MTPRTRAALRRQRAELVRALDGADDELVAAWVRAWDELAVELERAITGLWTASGDPISYLLRVRRLTAMQRLVAARLREVVDASAVTLTDRARDLIAASERAQLDLLAAMTPEPYASFGRLPVGATEQMVRRTTEQITSRMLPLSAEAARAMRSSLRIGIAAGEHPSVVARRMLRETRGIFHGGMARAVTIARTELMDAHRRAAQQVQQANRDVLTGWRWWCQLGPRTCLSCVAMHGSIHSLTESGPDGHPRCRCTRIPCVAGDRQDWGPTGADWLDAQPESVRREILGDAREDLRASGVPITEMVHTVHNPGWRDSVAPVPLRDL